MSNFITTYTGRHFEPANPDPDAICIEDIAHALSLITRGNGHVKTFWSVGEHCLCCAKEAAARGLSDRMVLACLLHDASECYMSDIPRPFKRELPEYREHEERLLDLIYEKFLGSPLTREESLEISAIYSVAGMIPEGQCLITERPFLAPHHTVTRAALAGGGAVPGPGIITLANRGVLFMDEFPEFGRETIDLMRQPMEDHEIRIARTTGTYVYPARFQLIAAMNPCPCGYYPDQRCRCTKPELTRYLSRISGPILDRMDLCAEVVSVKVQELMEPREEERSETIRQRVIAARKIQEDRFAGTGIRCNAEMDAGMVDQYCRLGEPQKRFVGQMFDRLGLSARAFHRMLKVARTIADLEGSGEITEAHLTEAAAYRTADRKYWNPA